MGWHFPFIQWIPYPSVTETEESPKTFFKIVKTTNILHPSTTNSKVFRPQKMFAVFRCSFNRLPVSHICPALFKLSNTSFAKFFESELCCAFDISLNTVIIYSISRHATSLSKQFRHLHSSLQFSFPHTLVSLSFNFMIKSPRNSRWSCSIKMPHFHFPSGGFGNFLRVTIFLSAAM